MNELLGVDIHNLEKLFKEAEGFESSDSSKALEKFTDLANLALKAENYAIRLECLTKTCRLNMVRGFYYKALHQGGTALKLINLHFPEKTTQLAYIYKELGAIYNNGFKSQSIALDYFYKALKYDIPKLNINLYNNIGCIYKDANLNDKALSYLNRGLKMAKRGQDDVILTYILENLGGVYRSLKQNDKAEAKLLEAIEVTNGALDDSPTCYIRGYVLNTLAELYLDTDRSAEAILLLEDALAVAKKNNHSSVVLESLINKGKYALSIENEQLFIDSTYQALEYAKEENISSSSIRCLVL